MEKILFIDTETGGLNPNNSSLLSLALIIWEDKIIKEKKEFFIKRKNYNISKEAFNINKLSPKLLNKIGLIQDDVKNQIIKIIENNFEKEKVILAGHNVEFDIKFFKTLFTEEEFNNLFSYRSLDTASILKYFSIKNKIKKNIMSLDKAIEYFHIDIKKRHSSLGDIEATVSIFNKLLER